MWAPVAVVLLSTSLVAQGAGVASAQSSNRCAEVDHTVALRCLLGPRVVASSFTSTPSLRSSDWSVDGSFWERPPAEGGVFDTYASGDVIEVTHRFNQDVVVSGEVGTVIYVGSKWRGARYVSGSGTDELVFQYTVKDSDLDLDGVSIRSSNLEYSGMFGSGYIHSELFGDGVNARLWPVYDGVANDANHKVGPVPYVTDIEVIGTDDEYAILAYSTPEDEPQVIEANGAVLLLVTYNTPVEVSGDPTFRLHLGDNDAADLEEGLRDARFRYRSYRDANVLVFHYLVEGGLEDTDGISIMNGHVGGEITAISGGRAAESYAFSEYRALTDFEVDPTAPPRAVGFEIISEPTHYSQGSDVADTYDVGDVIEIEVTFSEPIRTEHGLLPGPAAIEIKVGDTSRAAVKDFDDCCEDYVGYPNTGSGADGTGYTEVFAYKVQAGDLDADGISIEAVTEDDLYETGHRWRNLRRVGFNTHIAGADSGLRAEAIHDGMADQSGHRIGGVWPQVTGAAIVSTPAEGDTYSTGETIEVAFTFDTEVNADLDDGDGSGFKVYLDIDAGSPQGGMKASELAVATYDRGNGTDTLVFSYTLEGGESDPDGISVYGFTGEVTAVNGGVSRSWGYIITRLDPVRHLFSSQAGHKVNAPAPPRITGVEIVSTPTHRSPEAVSDDTYNAGDDIVLRVTFDESVIVPDTGESAAAEDLPALDIDIGGETRRAVIDFDYEPTVPGSPKTPSVGSPSSGSDTDSNAVLDAARNALGIRDGSDSSTNSDDVLDGALDEAASEAYSDLYFTYRVQADDYDYDGISVDAFTAADAFGDAIESRHSGLAVVGSHRGLSDQSGHLVGVIDPELLRVTVIDIPTYVTSDGPTYRPGDTMSIVLTYNTPVDVVPDDYDENGTVPTYRIAVGTTDVGEYEDHLRDATYVSGSGTTELRFDYVFERNDHDDTDGIELVDGPSFGRARGLIRATSSDRWADEDEGSGVPHEPSDALYFDSSAAAGGL